MNDAPSEGFKFVLDIQRLIIGVLLTAVAFFLIQIWIKLDTIDKSVDQLNIDMARVKTTLGIDVPAKK